VKLPTPNSQLPRRSSCGVTFCVLLILLAGGVSAESPPARRIVSLVPAVTEMLFAIGAGPQVVGVSSYDREPPEVDRLPRVGALLDPDLERILTLRPDLVVVYGSQDELRRQLDRAVVPVFPYRHAGLDGIFETIRLLGERTGHPARAAAVNERLRADLAAIRQRVAGRPPPRVLLVFGRDPDSLRNVFASGGVGFLHDVLGLANATNVLADVTREGLQISSEQILARRPEVIVELRAQGAPGDADEAARVWRAVSAVPAVRDGRVHALFGSDLVVPGPRIAQAAERIARVLHPEAW
jgi:iron complex transport system substrate-binding protein